VVHCCRALFCGGAVAGSDWWEWSIRVVNDAANFEGS
jgi:hypothetical protein